eukprot:6985946-Pyramimonas_sp.AAC.1
MYNYVPIVIANFKKGGNADADAAEADDEEDDEDGDNGTGAGSTYIAEWTAFVEKHHSEPGPMRGFPHRTRTLGPLALLTAPPLSWGGGKGGRDQEARAS